MNDAMDRMIFVAGFARGGTSWLRDCIAGHPLVTALPRERVIFGDSMDAQAIREYFGRETKGLPARNLIVNKAPAHSPWFAEAASLFPESKFIFILRDPRDVLVSHQRGTKSWMKGKNSDARFMLTKVQKYYEGLVKAQGARNVLSVRYEDLHQDFVTTLTNVFNFLELQSGEELIGKIANSHLPALLRGAGKNFAAIENADQGFRRGAVGEWSINLSEADQQVFGGSDWFRHFRTSHDYDEGPLLYSHILAALRDAGARFLDEDEVLGANLDPHALNVVLQHDIDLLNPSFSVKSILETLRINSDHGASAGFHFLPHDDPRYSSETTDNLLKIIGMVQSNSDSYAGLHLNAFEKFAPANQQDLDLEETAIAHAEEYTSEMVEWYLQEGVQFRLATAHGYGRGKRLPNNRDSPQMKKRLRSLGIELFDVSIRPTLQAKSSRNCALTDVGGFLKPRRLGVGGHLARSSTYEKLPPGTFLRFLTHPGNYPVEKGIVLEARVP